MTNLKEKLYGFQIRQEIAFDSSKMKHLEITVTIQKEELYNSIYYRVYHGKTLIHRGVNLDEAIEKYEKI